MPYRYGLPCVCEICLCGRHSCGGLKGCLKYSCQRTRPPPAPARTSSEYTEHYVPYPLCPVKSCRPPHLLLSSDDPVSHVTTSRESYIEHPLAERYKREPEVYHPPEKRLDNLTSYRQSYTPKNVEVTRPMQQIPRTESGAFEGEPTYRSDYRKWEMPEIQRSKSKEWSPPVGDFDGLTNYINDFKAFDEKPPKNCKPACVPIETGPFDTTTDYRQTYVKHPIKPRKRPEKVIWAKPSCPMDSISTSKEAYRPKQASRRDMVKPIVKPFLSDQPLSDMTTQRCDYKPWDIEIRERPKTSPDYVSPEGNIESSTTYRNDYHSHPDAKRPVKKDYIQREQPFIPFEGSTDYQTNYKGWNVPKPPLCKDLGQWSPPTEPLEDKTTHRIAYIPYKGARSASLCQRPIDSINNTNQPLETCTTYKQDFVTKSIKCPVAFKDTPSAVENRLIERDESTGHEFFIPLFVTIRNESRDSVTQIALIMNCDGKYTFKLPGSSHEYIVVPED